MQRIGVVGHKRTNMAVAIDAAGREVARWRGANTVAGWQELAGWATALGPAVRWGIAGAWNYGRGPAQCLVETGAAVYGVNARRTAAGRRRARTRGKSDRLDARAVALVAWREVGSLSPVTADDETGTVDLLVAEREGIVAESTRLRNQLHQLLLQLDPDHRTHIPSLKSQQGLRALETYATTDARALPQQRAAAVRRLAQRLRLLVEQARDLAAQIRALAATRFAPLATICGVDLLTADALAGLLGPGRRFASEARRAAYAGVAPLEASSAERVRHCLNRGGNRQRGTRAPPPQPGRESPTQCHPLPHRPDPGALLPGGASLPRPPRERGQDETRGAALERFIARAIWRQWQARQAHCTFPRPDRRAQDLTEEHGRNVGPQMSRRSRIRVMGASEDGDGPHVATRHGEFHARVGACGDALLQALMRPVAVEVAEVLAEHAPQVRLAQDQDVVEAFASHAPEDSLTD